MLKNEKSTKAIQNKIEFTILLLLKKNNENEIKSREKVHSNFIFLSRFFLAFQKNEKKKMRINQYVRVFITNWFQFMMIRFANKSDFLKRPFFCIKIFFYLFH